MQVLVIGGSRFVGYQTVWQLLAAGHHVTLFNRGRHPDPFGDRVERLTGDRTTGDFSRLLANRRFNATVDFAAYTAGDVQGVIDVLGGMRVGHYVFISTGQVYLVRQNTPQPAPETAYDGPLLAEPSNPDDRNSWLYGIHKRGAEDLLSEAWATERFPATRLRIPMVNGPRDTFRRIESYLWRIMDGGPVILPGGGEHLTRHVYSGDVARTVARLLGNTESFGQAYNLCQEEALPLSQLVKMLAELLGAPARLLPLPVEQVIEAGLVPEEISPFSDRWMSHLDPSKARTEIGFRHQPLQSYLETIVTCFVSYPPAEPPENYRSRQAELRLV